MAPPGAPPPLRYTPSAPSATPVPCTDAPTLPALEVATLRLLLAVVLPHHRVVSIAKVPTLRLTGIVCPVRHLPLAGLPPVPKGWSSRRPSAKRWTWPPTTRSSRPPLLPPAPSSERFEMATPRARSSTILPAPVGPAQGSRSLPPVEPDSPSPMSRTPSGLAR